MKSKHAWLIASDRAEKWLKSKVFRALFINKEQGVNSNLSAIENSIVHAFNKIRMRKVVIALQNFSAMSVKARIVSAKWDLRTKDKFMAVWQEQAFRKQKMSRMFSILQQQNYLKFISAFMLKLDDAATYMHFKKSIDAKYKAKAL